MRGAFSSKRHFLFDLDGTLVDSSGAHARAYVKALATDHPALARRFDYAPFAGQPTRQVFAALGLHDEPELTTLTQRKQQAYRDAMERGEVKLFPGAESLLSRLQSKERWLFIVTGASRLSAERILELTNLRTFFSGLVSAEDTQLGKPFPDPYLHALAAYHLASRDCLAIEDGESGVKSAQAAGLDTVLLHSELKFPNTLSVRDCGSLASLLLT